MNARGSTEVIVASIGLSMGVLSQNLFTLIVTMAVVTTMAMPTMLRWALNRLPLRKKERVRLEREELDARGFVTNLERLLLAADDSANGKLAARLIGVIAGSGDKPTTILDLTAKAKDGNAPWQKPKAGKSRKQEAESGSANGELSAHEVKTAAAAATTLEAHPDEEKSGNVDVMTRRDKTITPETVADEARKGYDFMVVGIAKTHDPNGGFSKDISLITKGFEGPLAIVDSHRSRTDQSAERYDRILIPVNGRKCRGGRSRSGSRWRAPTTRKSRRFMSRAPTPMAAPQARPSDPAQRARGAQGYQRLGGPLRGTRALARRAPTWRPTRRFCAKSNAAMISSYLA